MEAGEIRELTNSENTYLTHDWPGESGHSIPLTSLPRQWACMGPQDEEDGGPAAHRSPEHPQVKFPTLPHHLLYSQRPLPRGHHCPPYRKLEPRAGSCLCAPPQAVSAPCSSHPPHLTHTPPSTRWLKAASSPGATPRPALKEGQPPRKGEQRFPPGDRRPRAKVREQVRYPKAPSQLPLETRSHPRPAGGKSARPPLPH